ncbi:hypothetical protein BKA61DRAFT_579742 [Leptodontidium sp. MPI-SDFR-AT-0119]|nr:hypothetical protein BKA61DRAFT_579742 [Leptodontidium sp. MPI-SDFR-AT-0119]
MHAALRESAKKAGLGDKYKIISCGAELESLVSVLFQEGLLGEEKILGNGVFDEIARIRILCSVQKPTETVNGPTVLLYGAGMVVLLGGCQLSVFARYLQA